RLAASRHAWRRRLKRVPLRRRQGPSADADRQSRRKRQRERNASRSRRLSSKTVQPESIQSAPARDDRQADRALRQTPPPLGIKKPSSMTFIGFEQIGTQSQETQL